ncbi:unnamed protein product [Danaus chrysippus]|uniref:(African queen) hypothetical protein n=1 Tax=Danaus chrysippus TaxID=151541 RepID=A0A8J2QSA1_9NEOP|nr:unnamed protein product [Danaus chrysippus]
MTAEADGTCGLRSPVPPTSSIRNRMAVQNKTVNKGRATNVHAAAAGRIHEGTRAARGSRDPSITQHLTASLEP